MNSLQDLARVALIDIGATAVMDAWLACSGAWAFAR